MAPCNSRNLPFSLFVAFLYFYFLLFIPRAYPLNFSFSSFETSDDHIQLLGNASISLSKCISLTTDQIDLPLNFIIGQAVYREPVHLWDRKRGILADFTTHFSFIIKPGNGNPQGEGDGLAFFLANFTNSTILDSTAGGGLGLFNTNVSDNPVVAVEFDTWKNKWDPDDNHMGIDIKSIVSVSNVTLNASLIKNQKPDGAMITYNSSSKLLSVYLAYDNNRVSNGASPYLSYTIDLRKYLPEWVTVGFSATTGSATELHEIFSWDFYSSLETGNSSSRSVKPNKMGMKVEILVSCGAAILVGGLCLIWYVMIMRKKQESEADDDDGGVVLDASMDEEFEKETGPRRFSYAELARATNNFDAKGKIGEGGFGGVYRGFLSDLSLDIAVKRISKGSKQGIKEYVSEVKIISRLRHKNLVQLVGWCHQCGELLLVYEFMPNGSLDSHLYGNRGSMIWELRYKITLDLSYALLYLHEEWEQCVIHRDIKSSNVILDFNFNAKLGDFGLARLVEHGKWLQTTILAGTLGYMALEYVFTGKSSKESDVYSFGMVTLEISCGRRPIEMNIDPIKVRLVEWVWELYGRGTLLEAADPSQRVDFNEQQVERLLVVGLWCAHPDYNLRPSIRQAMQVLNFDAPLPILPSKMPMPPYFSTPSNMSAFTITSSQGST